MIAAAYLDIIYIIAFSIIRRPQTRLEQRSKIPPRKQLLKRLPTASPLYKRPILSQYAMNQVRIV